MIPPSERLTRRLRAARNSLSETASRTLRRGDGALREQLAASERRCQELRERLLEARVRAVGAETLGQLAHAIANPLTALISAVQLAAATGEPPDSERVVRLARRIAAVVDGLSAFSQAQRSARLERVEPGVLLADAALDVSERARRAGVRLEVAAGELAPIRVDRALLATALAALAENAIDASPRGERVTLSGELDTDASSLVLAVVDHGNGIGDELRSLIFQPYFTTKPTGTGLGLAIARAIADGHEAAIRVETKLGVGSRFAIELPAPAVSAEA